MRQARKRVENAEAEISRLEKEIALIEDNLAKGNTDDTEIYTRHALLNKALEEAMTTWEEASAAVDELAAKYAR